MATAETVRENGDPVVSCSARLSRLSNLDGLPGAYPRSYKTDELLYIQGDEADGLMLLREGQVELFIERAGRVFIQSLRPPSILAEAGYLVPSSKGSSTPNIHPTSARAITSCEVLVLSQEGLRGVFAKDPDLSVEILGLVTSRIRVLESTAQILKARYTVPQRVAVGLLHSEEEGFDPQDSLPSLALHISGQWGTPYGSTRRMVGGFKKKGIIEVNGRVVISNPQALAFSTGTFLPGIYPSHRPHQGSS